MNILPGRKFDNKSTYFIVSGFISLFLLYLIIIKIYSKIELSLILQYWQIWNLRLCLFLLIILLVTYVDDVKSYFLKLRNNLNNYKIIFFILLVVFSSFIVTNSAPKTHRIYYDEDIYSNIGQNIAEAGRAGYSNYATYEYGELFIHWIKYNKDPYGWPFIQSLVFQSFGTDEHLIFYVNNILYLLSVITTFFIAFLLSGNRIFPGIIAGVIYATLPHNLIWSNTTAAEPAAALFSGLCVLAFLLFMQNGSKRALVVLAGLFPFAVQMRMESILIGAVFVAGVLLFPEKRMLAQKKTWVAALGAGALTLPFFVHLYSVQHHTWGAGSAGMMSLRFFVDNIKVNGPYFFLNNEFPVIVSVLACIGFLYGKKILRERLLLLLWFLLFWVIFLFFYAGNYHYGADDRFAILTFMPLSILAAFGSDCLAGAAARLRYCNENPSIARLTLLTVIILTFHSFLPKIRQTGQEAWAARADHQYALDFISILPERSLVLSHNPSLFLLRGISAAQTYAATGKNSIVADALKRFDGNVYFHYNYWCNTGKTFAAGLCAKMMDKYRMKPVATRKMQHYEYTLYRITAVRSSVP